MKTFTTEITSDTTVFENPIHQRLYFPYIEIKSLLHKPVDKLLEIGCGEGRGYNELQSYCNSYTGIDKNKTILKKLSEKYSKATFIPSSVPPLTSIANNEFDVVVSFQVIEHIKKDRFFLEEIKRVLKPGGIAFLTTPNRKKTLTRNPWHIREYIANELRTLTQSIFNTVTMKGIHGNAKVMNYYESNKKSVQKITRWDFLKLQYRLPAFLLRIPYELLNKLNRKKLDQKNHALVAGITHKDYYLSDDVEGALDFLVIVKK